MSSGFSVRGTKFLLTWPQSTPLTFEIIKNHLMEIGDIEYLIIGEEEHRDQNLHYHAVVVFKKRIQRRNNIFTIDEFVCNVKIIGKKKKDLKACIEYVKKEENFMEYGVSPLVARIIGKREKLKFAIEHTNQECIESGLFSINEILRLNHLRTLATVDWPMFRKRKVIWLYGKTGCGKTKKAFEDLAQRYNYVEDIWIAAGDLKNFFNGYYGQRAVILDDLRPGAIKFEMLLRILDGYPVTINIKGGYVQWLAEEIYITAPCKPNDMYVNRETGQEWDNLDQLLRRLDDIIDVEEMNEDTQRINI